MLFWNVVDLRPVLLGVAGSCYGFYFIHFLTLLFTPRYLVFPVI